jgi:hypothetical protein
LWEKADVSDEAKLVHSLDPVYMMRMEVNSLNKRLKTETGKLQTMTTNHGKPTVKECMRGANKLKEDTKTDIISGIVGAITEKESQIT